MNSTFQEELELKKKEIEDIISDFSPRLDEDTSILAEAVNYSLLAGGKRLRPLIMLESYRLFKGTNEAIVKPFAAALEMIHTYSLIHDDLPAMDNDDLRRGRPTNHKVYGEAMAILAGDGLLNLATETAAKAFDYSEKIEEYKKISEAIKELFYYSGIRGMIGGQVLDIISEEGKREKDEAFFVKMYELKTGGLITAAFVIGALLAGADEKELEEIRRTGNAFGLVFQLQDDLLDVLGDEKTLGKPVHSDDKNNKLTYLKLVGLDRAKEIIATNNSYIADELKRRTEKNKSYDGFMMRLAEYVESRDR